MNRSTPRPHHGSAIASIPVLSACALSVCVLSACRKDGEDSSSPAPDVAGNYQVFPTGTVGCEPGDEVLITDWAEGPLQVEGEADALSFDFGEDYAFAGYVGSDSRFRFSGEATSGTNHLDIEGQGTFENEGGFWKIDGQMDALVDDDGLSSNDCTLTVSFEATELHAAP